MFAKTYANKKVLITGNTGFKGAWLSLWLKQLGASICGYSLDIPTSPSLYSCLNLASICKQYFADIKDADHLRQVIHQEKPDFIFHLAAQAIVATSYTNPTETILTNAIGTMNLCEALRTVTHPCVVLVITSDKCYENIESLWGYKETDNLGGKDIYSASKAAAENIFHAYHHSFLKKMPHIRLASARAGNVIGGGDWAANRIIVDCVKAWNHHEAVVIRNPHATRPWQHVLEPLSAYLTLGQHLFTSKTKIASCDGEAFNFGPRAEQNRQVHEVLVDLYEHWDKKITGPCFKIIADQQFYEAGLLKLNCDKALYHLQWSATLDYQKTIEYVGSWYNNYYCHANSDMLTFTLQQITDYEKQRHKTHPHEQRVTSAILQSRPEISL